MSCAYTGFLTFAPDMLGFGQTEAPDVPPEDLSVYSWKSMAADMAELLCQLAITKAIVIGHDLGAMVAFRMYFWRPELVTHIASICLPYFPPIESFVTLPEIVERCPNFTYRLALVNPQTEHDFASSPGTISKFLRAIHRGKDDSPVEFQVTENLLEHLGDPGVSNKLWTEEDSTYYVEQFSRNGMHGPLNWYKTDRVNFDEEKYLVSTKIEVPTLFIRGIHDAVLPPPMWTIPSQFVPNLTLREVDAGHEVLEEVPVAVNALLCEWFAQKVFGVADHLEY